MVLQSIRSKLGRVFGGGVITLVLLSGQPVASQTGTGGVNSLFSEAGVGSRAFSLGNAYVAMATDPTVVYWNPGALDFLEKKSASFYYSSLIAGSNYSYFGLVYPTISVGSFGFGWIRLGTGDVVERSDAGVEGRTFGFSQQQFLFSYGKQLFESLSGGFSVKIERFDFGEINVSDAGFGVDVGLLYRPDLDSDILRDVSLGFNIQNLFRPQLRLQERSVPSPVNFKVGLAKPFYIGEEGSAFTLAVDFDKSEDAPSRYHVGGEYSFRGQGMVRVGLNDGQVTFGAGARLQNFHLDYSFGQFFDSQDFSGDHRFTVTFEFGKKKSEIVRLARERREREIRRQLASQLWVERELEYNTSFEEGRDYYYDGEYLNAYVRFQAAVDAAKAMLETAMRLRGEVNNDPEVNIKVSTANSALQEAESMLDSADVKYDQALAAERQRIIEQAQQTALEGELRDFIIEHREKGNAFFRAGDYVRAINEWQLAINRIDSEDQGDLPAWLFEVRQQLQDDIDTAENQLKGDIQESIRRADNLARRGDYVQALNVLNELRGLGVTESERKTIQSKIRELQAQLTFQENYERGLQHYANKEWEKAMQYFELALKIKPNDPNALKHYDEAKARANARVQAMPPNIQAKFVRGVQLYRQGRFEDALEIWEEIREQQPYNKRILDAIDNARERLQKQR